MGSWVHRLALLFGALAVSLPAADELPGTSSKWVRLGVSAIGGLSLFLTTLDKVKSQKPPATDVGANTPGGGATP